MKLTIEEYKELDVWKNELQKLKEVVDNKISFLQHRITYLQDKAKYKR